MELRLKHEHWFKVEFKGNVYENIFCSETIQIQENVYDEYHSSNIPTSIYLNHDICPNEHDFP